MTHDPADRRDDISDRVSALIHQALRTACLASHAAEVLDDALRAGGEQRVLDQRTI